MRRIVHAFLAGAIAVLAVHQPMLAALHALGILSWPAYSLAPTRPFGVPAVLSQAFFAGLWATVLLPLAEHSPTARGYYARALVHGALVPTVVGIALTLLGHGYPPGRTSPLVAVTAGAAINAAWMAATAWIATKLAGRA